MTSTASTADLDKPLSSRTTPSKKNGSRKKKAKGSPLVTRKPKKSPEKSKLDSFRIIIDNKSAKKIKTPQKTPGTPKSSPSIHTKTHAKPSSPVTPLFTRKFTTEKPKPLQTKAKRGKVQAWNIRPDISSDDLSHAFQNIENFSNARIVLDPSGKSTGTAFIEFLNENSAKQFVQQYDGVTLDGLPMKLELVDLFSE